ncbi:13618_t:CDS:2, partial [Gigaspora margarita]
RTVTPVKDQGFRSSPVQEPEFHSPLLERLQQNQERTVTPVKDQGFRSSPVQEPEFHSPLLERIQQNQERTLTPTKDQAFRSSPVQEPEFHSPLLERLQQNQERTVTPTKDQVFRSSPVQEPEFHSPLLERLQQNQEHIITPTKDRSSPVQEPEFHSPLLERLQQNQEHIITPTKDQGFHSNYSTVQEPEFHSPLPLRIQQDHIHSPMPQRLHSPISPMQDYESSFSGYFPETSEDSQSNWSILDLQNFIDTSRTFDILTKQPRKVNLVLQPPNLPFNREIVLYEDFVIEVPEYDSDERFHVRAHLFLLTDLLLVCQKIEPKDQKSISNFKYWLMYQPLSGKHLSIRDTSYEEGAMLELTIMRDETLIIYPQTDDVKDTWFKEISNAIKFASVGSMRPQVNTDVKNLNSAGSSPRTLSPSPNTGVLTPNSSGSRSRSPTNSRLSPTNSRLSPTNSGLSPNNNNNMGHSPIGSRKPGLPSRPNQYLGTSNSRSQALDIQRKSNRISDPSSPNSVYRSQSLNSLKRSNSISSLKSVASIAVMREKIFESSPCQIFYWINGNWKPLTTKDLCIVEVRVTTMNKGCWAILLQKTNRMILNAWIHSNTIIERNSPTTTSISCEMGLNKEFYRVSMSIPEEADRFFANLNKVKQIPLENSNNLLLPPQGLISRSSSLQSLQRNDSLNREVEKSSKLAMECRCRLFLQNDHGIWTNLGWGKMQLEIESPSQRRKLVVNSEKQNKKLVDAILREDGVERVGRAGVAITLNSIDPANSKRIIYMMQMKEEAMAVKAYKIMKQGRY